METTSLTERRPSAPQSPAPATYFFINETPSTMEVATQTSQARKSSLAPVLSSTSSPQPPPPKITDNPPSQPRPHSSSSSTAPPQESGLPLQSNGNNNNNTYPGLPHLLTQRPQPRTPPPPPTIEEHISSINRQITIIRLGIEALSSNGCRGCPACENANAPSPDPVGARIPARFHERNPAAGPLFGSLSPLHDGSARRNGGGGMGSFSTGFARAERGAGGGAGVVQSPQRSAYYRPGAAVGTGDGSRRNTALFSHVVRALGDGGLLGDRRGAADAAVDMDVDQDADGER